MSLDTDGKHSAASDASFLISVTGSANLYQSSNQLSLSISG